MKQHTAIFIALALTVFVLVLGGATAFSIVMQTRTAETAQVLAAEAPSLAENAASNNPAVQDLAPRALAVVTPRPTTVAAIAQPMILAPERAAQIARTRIANGKLQQPPELVNYKGKMAYEVLLSTGRVYVDAFNGTVLASIAFVPPTPTPSPEPNVSNDSNTSNNNADSGNQKERTSAPNDVPPAPPPADPTDPPAPPPSGQHQHDGGNNQSGDDEHGNGDDHHDDDNGGKQKQDKHKQHKGNGGQNGGNGDDGGHDDND